jgi:endonuclease/exonuclease/phosphatase (EEP) superfamily protein YafD
MTHLTLTPEQIAQVAASALKKNEARVKQHERKLAAANERTVDWKTRALKYRKELLEAKQEIADLRKQAGAWINGRQT